MDAMKMAPVGKARGRISEVIRDRGESAEHAEPWV